MESPAVKDSQIPEEIVSDTSNSLLNDRSETPDSSRGQQDNDSVTSSPKISKPVLGKAQAKKRLMAFAKFTASVKQSLEKQKEKNQQKDSDPKKPKPEEPKDPQDLSKIFKTDELSELSASGDSERPQNPPKKPKKRSEKKLAAIEEIMREESKQKQLISLESLEKAVAVDKFQFRHQSEQKFRDFNRRFKENRFRSWEDRRFNRFDRKSPFSRQNNDRKSPFFERRRRTSSERRENDRRDRKERKRSKSHEQEPPEDEKIEKKNWEDFKSSGNSCRKPVDLEARASLIELHSKSAQEYRNSLEQMLMIDNSRPQRSCVLINGIDDSQREYPPESIRITRKFNKNIFYSENPSVSMTWNRRQLFQVLSPDRCRLMKRITEVPQNVEAYEAPKVRNWYKRLDSNGRLEIVRCSVDKNSPEVPPKSRWEVEPEEIEPNDGQLEKSEIEDEKSTLEEGEISREDAIDDSKEQNEGTVPEELVSEYEEFMKIVSTEVPEKSSPQIFPEIEKIEEERILEAKIEEKLGELRSFDGSEKADAVGDEEEDEELKHLRNKSKSRGFHKKKQKKRVSTSESTDSSSSSESEAERKRRRKRKRKKKRARDSSTDSSTSEDSSSDEKTSRRRKKSSKRKKKGKRSKLRKKRARRDSSDSESSDSSNRSSRSRKKKKKRRNSSKHSKSSKRGRSRSSEELRLRKIKIEIDEEIQLEKSPIKLPEPLQEPLNEKIVIKLEKERSPNILEAKESLNPPELPEIPLETEEIWEKKGFLDPESLKNPEESSLKPEEIPLPTPKSPEKSPPKPDEENPENLISKKQKRRSTSTSSSSSSSTSSYSSSSSSSGSMLHRKRNYSSKPERSHNRRRNAAKGMRRSKSKWVTEFDFDFPSLTQLEQAPPVAGPVDDWEVDSLEDIRDFASSYVKEKSKKSRKVEKEVRYDEKTDTYIAVEKECLQENQKKPPGRVCALRIWEDEEEEGEREAAMMEKSEVKVIEWQEPVPVPPIEGIKEVPPEEPEKGAEAWIEEKKSPEASIRDPPTPEGPLVPVNWEEEEEWTTSLVPEIKPSESKEEPEKNEEIEGKPETLEIPEDKDKLYSPSSAADSQKSEGSSDSSDSSSDSSSSSGSSESDGESRGEKRLIKEPETKIPVSPGADEFLIEKAGDPSETMQKLKMDMLLQIGGRDFITPEPKDSPNQDQVSSKSPKIDASLPESPKPKEVFRNTFVEIISPRSPDRRQIPKDPEKKPRISEERTSNSSFRSSSRTPKDSEKPKFDRSPRSDRRRFTSPERRFPEKRRSSPSWHRRHSRSRSWSRSRSRSPDRRDRQKRFKYEDRRERFSRSPRRTRRSHERDWSLETSTDKSYDPLELLRGVKRPRDSESRKSGAEESQDLYETRLPSELGFADRNYRDSLEREIMEGPMIDSEPRSRYRRDRTSWDRRESPERFRKRSLERRPRSRLSPRSRHSPRRSEKGRFLSRSRSRSWTRSRSRSRTRSRSLTRSRSRSRSRSSTRRRKSRSRSFSPRRRRRDDVRYRRSNSRDRVRQIETIVHPPGMNPPPPEEMSNSMINDSSQVSFRYQETEDYFYPRNNLTYPPRVEETSGSPKRLSLDDRLELELGIKKQENASYPQFPMIPGNAPIPMRVPGPQGFHRQPTVLQVGNVLQVVPRDFQGSAGVPPPVPGTRTDLPGPVGNGNRVLRVGNVLQVVPTPLDWTESANMELQVPPYPPPVPAVLPIPVPLPVTASPHPLPVPVPQVPGTPVPAPKAPPKPHIPQPVYNYEAILEVRKKEKEERRRLREERRAEKEKRRIIKMRKKAEKAMEKAKKISEDILEKEEEAGGNGGEDPKEYAGDDDEDEEVELEGDEDDEEEEEVEESEEEPEDEDSRVIPGLGDAKDEEEEVKIEIESVNIPVAPKKGILVPPGLWANRLINGDAGENEAELQESIEKLQFAEDYSEDSDDYLERSEEEKERRMKSARSRVRKSVQFADGIKPGEGTSPSGCEGDMPSPPPPASASLNDPMRDLVKRGRKILRKKTKRVKLPKTKKKVKVKIIKIKKPRITPLTELMLDDSDELDDRSPPPPPPGSPPPPHLWPSYLAAYSATLKPVEVVALPSAVQTAPPPTPLPLLVPPPPLNYTIQPLNKA